MLTFAGQFRSSKQSTHEFDNAPIFLGGKLKPCTKAFLACRVRKLFGPVFDDVVVIGRIDTIAQRFEPLIKSRRKLALARPRRRLLKDT
jgi:hypothetical protein